MKFVIVVVSILLMMPIVSLVSSCKDTGLQPTPPRGPTTTSGSPVENRRDECADNAGDVCEGDRCSSDSSYCEYHGGSTNNKCNKACKALFTKDARKECLRYKPDIIFDIEEMVDKIFKRPTENNLTDVDDELLCVLLKISPQPWLDEIEDYSRSRAETVLKWIVDEDIGTYFVDDDDQKEVMEQLFVELGGGERVTSQNIFKGFQRNIEDDNDDDLPSLFYVSENDSSSGSETFQFVHELILVDEICKNSNRPKANVARVANAERRTQCGGKPCYGSNAERDADLRSGTSRVSTEDAEGDFDLQACILGVYCHVADGNHDADKDDLRENAADNLDGSDVVDFIEKDVADGGLGIEDGDEWPDEACEELKKYWNNNNSLDLGLGT